MKRLLSLCLILATAPLLATDPAPRPAASAQAQAINTICPVSGDQVGSVGKPVYVEYNGKKIAFCCKDCVKKFRKNPDKYAKLAEKNESAHEGM
ncbi:MAG: YHS domain-containing protein [Verrucomicrobia bacterium]|nr:YHS domain-containing protein [Verrucomicrobiota bacterium]